MLLLPNTKFLLIMPVAIILKSISGALFLVIVPNLCFYLVREVNKMNQLCPLKTLIGLGFDVPKS